LTADQHQQLLRAALPTGERSVTLYEEIHPVKKLGNRRVQQRFLSSLQALLPANVTPIIVADSGFRTPFFREVESLVWHWLGRIRNRDCIAWANRPNDWLPAKSLYAKATRKPKCLGSAHWVRSHPLGGELVAFYQLAKGRKHLTAQHRPSKSSASRKHAKREQEPWLLVVSPSLKAFSAARVVAYYRSRMQIEEGLRDTKSTHYGLDFTNESRIEAEHRANLLLIAALIFFALWLTVEIYAKPEAWQKLGSDDFNERLRTLPACRRNSLTRTKKTNASICWYCAPSLPFSKPGLISPA